MKTELKSAKVHIFVSILLYQRAQMGRYMHAPNMKQASIKGLPNPQVTTTLQWRDSDSLQ